VTWEGGRWGLVNRWDPTDPNRPCFTCGARPRGTFQDGSPGYDCAAVHGGQAWHGGGQADLAPSPCPDGCRSGAAVRVWVPGDLVAKGRRRCRGQVAAAEAKDRQDNNGAEARRWAADDPWACVAEHAVGIVWDLDVLGGGYQAGKADLAGGIEVRYTTRADGSLLLKPQDQVRAHRPFVLVTGPYQDTPQGAEFHVHGWMLGTHAMADGYWWTPTRDQAGRRACWRVPQGHLHHPDHLPRGVARGQGVAVG